MLDIIRNQRDRFRDRNDNLETSNRSLQEQVQRITAEMAELRDDNLKLYEKIKFLQSYQGQKVFVSMHGGRPRHGAINVDVDMLAGCAGDRHGPHARQVLAPV